MKQLPILALAALLAAPAATAFADEKPSAAPDMAAMMEAMTKAGKPGAQHKQLEKYVGDWTYSLKMWMDPSAPPMELKGTMHAESQLGGRHIVSVWKGDFMGAPFEGHALEAYDNVAGQFVNTWVDNQSTGIMYSTGKPSDDGKSVTYLGEMLDPMSKQKSSTKSVITWLSDDSFKNESFYTDPTGKEVPSMVIVATRKK